MSTPPGPEGWPNMAAGTPSPEFLAAFQAEMTRRAAEAATGATDPLTPMDALFVTAHTTFEAACRAGFTERQAVVLVAELMTRQP